MGVAVSLGSRGEGRAVGQVGQVGPVAEFCGFQGLHTLDIGCTSLDCIPSILVALKVDQTATLLRWVLGPQRPSRMKKVPV